MVGKVAALTTLPVQDLLTVKADNGKEILVPFVEEIVPEVNVEGGYILITRRRGSLRSTTKTPPRSPRTTPGMMPE